MKPVLLVMGNQILPAEMAVLEENFEIIRLWKEPDPEAVLQARREEIIAMVSVYFVPVSRTLIEALPNLRIIAQFAVGVDNIDLGAARERGIVVTNTPDVLTEDTADIALSLILSLSRRICEADLFVRIGKWKGGPMLLGHSLSGKTAGIVGMGRIGRAIASRCAAFGMNIVYYGPSKKDDISYEYIDSLQALSEVSDYLVLACPGGEKTRNLVHAPVLEALGPSGYLINVSRGSVVNEDDLVTALYNKKIAGAGLDVYAAEPEVRQEFIRMDNVVLLPHIGSATVETRAVMGRLVVENLLANLKGDVPLTPVAL